MKDIRNKEEVLLRVDYLINIENDLEVLKDYESINEIELNLIDSPSLEFVDFDYIDEMKTVEQVINKLKEDYQFNLEEFNNELIDKK